ncbi:uncharacterized protein LODBEIA_P10770 [Lodderomyces beijingensis]|uniref:Autophagy-related protein 13 n=1 Tax=Lodderomyces beijingensis TaxID=1775926 RepID=A0ABP0ZFC8_9ASCO
MSSDQIPKLPVSDPQARKHTAKLHQVLVNFFTKAAQIILDSRSSSSELSLYSNSDLSSAATTSQPYADGHGHGQGHNQGHGHGYAHPHPHAEDPVVKINKWFNLHMISTSATSKDDLKLWKNPEVITLPPMIIETYLDLRQLPSNQTLVLFDEQKHPWTVVKPNGKKQEVVLERWLIEFDQSSQSDKIILDELPLIYKQAIILFRTIYGFSRLMPAYKLKKKNPSNKLSLGNKILDGNQPISSKGRIGLSKPIVNNNIINESESHMTQKNFKPINTSLGMLKISIAYRNHYDFCLHEHEEVLSVHFTKHDEDAKKKLSSISPSSSLASYKDQSSSFSKDVSNSPKTKTSRPNSFKIGSIGNSPPSAQVAGNTTITTTPTATGTPTTTTTATATATATSHATVQPQNMQAVPLERKVSITSSKSISNASLAAFLRNPRSSTPSASNIPISTSNNSNANNPYSTSIPRSIGSSTGQDEIFVNPDSASNTPRFSSSFGSRASRRFSNTSIRQQTPQSDYFTQGNNSVDAALSGLYGDDDISDFVRMIDSTSDLKLSGGHSSSHDSDSRIRAIREVEGTESKNELKKYQSMKNKHQQLSDSVNASIILQSRQSSRKSSLNSPPGSFDQNQVIVSSRMRESSSRSNSVEPNRPLIVSRFNSSNVALPSTSTSTSTSVPAPAPAQAQAQTHKPQTQAQAQANAHAHAHAHADAPHLNKMSSVHSTATSASVNRDGGSRVMPNMKSGATTVVSGLATSPSIYDYRSVSLRSGDNSNDDELGSAHDKSRKSLRKEDEDEDDLLFTMSDMNPK